MAPQQQTSREYFNMIFLLYYVLLAGQIVVLSVLFFVLHFTEGIGIISDNGNVFIIIVTAVWIGSILISNRLSDRRTQKVKEKIELKEKLSEFRMLIITRYMFFEGPTIVASVLYFMSGSQILLGIAIAMILIFIANKPNKEKIIASLELNTIDQIRLENPDEIVAEIGVNVR